jgi:hypothetical protein
MKLKNIQSIEDFLSEGSTNESVYPDRNGQLTSYDKKNFVEVGRHTVTMGKDLAAIFLFGYNKGNWRGQDEWTVYVTCTSFDTTVRNLGNSNGSIIYQEAFDAEDSAKSYTEQLYKSFKVK